MMNTSRKVSRLLTVVVFGAAFATLPSTAFAGGLVLETSGTCPGPPATLRIEASGGTPSGDLALMAAKVPGSFIPNGGPCPGVEIGLQNPILVDTLTLDFAGRLDVEIGVPAAACGGLVQVMDLTTCAPSTVEGIPAEDDKLFGLELIADNVKDPTAIVATDDGTGRLFFVSQRGQVSVFDGQQQLPELFLNISSKVVCCFERGLLGFAVHPEFATNGEFYVNYTAAGSGDTTISRFQVSDTDPNVADPDSEEILLVIEQPDVVHNGGQLAFGPDGYLYIGVGDGGPQADPDGNGQNVGVLLAKILRIDVDSATEPLAYSIPPDNPLIGFPGAREEIWATGVRNPWRLSFDRQTGDLFIADVGQEIWEEINVQPASSTGGENYGWKRMEGPDCFEPSQNCDPLGNLVVPAMQYRHFEAGEFNGCSVTGGFVYRGTAIPGLAGKYLFADWCTGNISTGTDNGGTWTTEIAMRTIMNITTFGEDENGELYVAEYRRSPDEGGIYRLVPVDD